jgi:hypothetical protein
MLERLLNWFRSRDDDDVETPERSPMPNRSVAGARPAVARPVVTQRPAPANQTPAAAVPAVRVKTGLSGAIADLGAGKNVLVRGSDQPDDSGTHDALSIFGEEPVPKSEEAGIDPYNTGKFDRSKNWDKRFR